MMRKYIPLDDIEKYIKGEYSGIGVFIARQEDVIHLKTF